MDTPSPYRRITLFAAGLAAVFGVAVGLGSLVEPAETDGDGAGGKMEAHASETDTDHGAVAGVVQTAEFTLAVPR